MLAGRTPFEGETETGSDYEVMEAHVRKPPPDPCMFYSAIPEGVVNVLLKALFKDPQGRHASAAAFLTALETAAEGHSVEAVDVLGPSPAPTTPSPTGRSRVTPAVASPTVLEAPTGRSRTEAGGGPGFDVRSLIRGRGPLLTVIGAGLLALVMVVGNDEPDSTTVDRKTERGDGQPGVERPVDEREESGRRVGERPLEERPPTVEKREEPTVSPGSITVVSEPSDAEVYVVSSGELLGRTPLRLESLSRVPDGRIRLEMKGRWPEEEVLPGLEQGVDREVSVVLREPPRVQRRATTGGSGPRS